MARPSTRRHKRIGQPEKGNEVQPIKIAVIGIDLGKNSCSLAALDDQGAVVKRRRMRPDSIVAFGRNLPACVIAMEACCGAHHLDGVTGRPQPSWACGRPSE